MFGCSGVRVRARARVRVRVRVRVRFWVRLRLGLRLDAHLGHPLAQHAQVLRGEHGRGRQEGHLPAVRVRVSGRPVGR